MQVVKCRNCKGEGLVEGEVCEVCGGTGLDDEEVFVRLKPADSSNYGRKEDSGAKRPKPNYLVHSPRRREGQATTGSS